MPSVIGQPPENSARLFQALQVKPHTRYGYRPAMRAYTVIENIEAARANPQFGKGGAEQFFIRGYQTFLEGGELIQLDAKEPRTK